MVSFITPTHHAGIVMFPLRLTGIRGLRRGGRRDMTVSMGNQQQPGAKFWWTDWVPPTYDTVIVWHILCTMIRNNLQIALQDYIVLPTEMLIFHPAEKRQSWRHKIMTEEIKKRLTRGGKLTWRKAAGSPSKSLPIQDWQKTEKQFFVTNQVSRVRHTPVRAVSHTFDPPSLCHNKNIF